MRIVWLSRDGVVGPEWQSDAVIVPNAATWAYALEVSHASRSRWMRKRGYRMKPNVRKTGDGA